MGPEEVFPSREQCTFNYLWLQGECRLHRRQLDARRIQGLEVGLVPLDLGPTLVGLVGREIEGVTNGVIEIETVDELP